MFHTHRVTTDEMAGDHPLNENTYAYIDINSPSDAETSDDLIINESYGQSLPVYNETLNVSYEEVQQSNHYTDKNNYAIVAKENFAPGTPEVHIQNPIYGDTETTKEDIYAHSMSLELSHDS